MWQGKGQIIKESGGKEQTIYLVCFDFFFYTFGTKNITFFQTL